MEYNIAFQMKNNDKHNFANIKWKTKKKQLKMKFFIIMFVLLYKKCNDVCG